MTDHDHDARLSAEDAAGTPAQGTQVLIVEDDGDTRILFRSHLRRLGCSVVEVATGEAALSAARRQHPDIAIIDLRLPGITGEQVMEELRADPDTAHCRVVITSVLDSESYPATADGVLPKPFTRREFEDLLTPLIAKNIE